MTPSFPTRRSSDRKKAGTAGWYNSAAFDKFAKAQGLYSKSINGDAFSNEARARVIELIKNEMGGQVDLVVYSLASPVRKLRSEEHTSELQSLIRISYAVL